MFEIKKFKVNLTKDETTGEFGMVLWLDTKSNEHAHGLVKQIVELLNNSQKKHRPIDVGQFMKGK